MAREDHNPLLAESIKHKLEVWHNSFIGFASCCFLQLWLVGNKGVPAQTKTFQSRINILLVKITQNTKECLICYSHNELSICRICQINCNYKLMPFCYILHALCKFVGSVWRTLSSGWFVDLCSRVFLITLHPRK